MTVVKGILEETKVEAANEGLYSISYDLAKKPKANYDRIKEHLQEHNHVKLMETYWVIRQEDTTAREIRDGLKPLFDVDSGDVVIVTKISRWSGLGLPSKFKSL